MAGEKGLFIYIDDIIYSQLKAIQNNGFWEVGYDIVIPSKMRSLQNLKLVEIEIEEIQDMYIPKTTLKIFITELGLNSILNYEMNISEAKAEYFTQLSKNINALNISEESRAEIFMLLEIMKISTSKIDLKDTLKLIRKSMKKDKSLTPFISSIVASLIANYIHSIFMK